MSHVSDFDHRRIDAKIFPDHCVVESHEISDASRGLRRVPVTRVWRTERLLGKGGFGEVHLQSQDSDRDAKRALKIIPTRGMKLSLADCQRELTAMIEFTKPKYKDAAVFVDFHGWFQNDDAVFLAMEYMPLGDLEQNLREIEKSPTHSGPPLSEEEAQEVSRQILEGLKIMHAEGFAHRDLKPQNVFVVQKQPLWWVKLGDFGLSKKRTEGTAYRTHAGTEQYMAPELFHYVKELDNETSEYTNAIDLWSLGCIIYRGVTGSVPFPSLLSLRNYCWDPAKAPLNMPPTMEEAGNFVATLLMPHPAKRPNATAALESTWLTVKNKPKITFSDMEASFDTLNISRSQNNYNTASHKGLQSYYSQPMIKESPTSPTTHGSLSAPLPLLADEMLSKTINAEPQSKPQEETEQETAVANATGLSIEPASGLKPPSASLYRSMSQPTRSMTTTQPKDISVNGSNGSLKKHLSVQALQVTDLLQPVTKEGLISSLNPSAASELSVSAMLASKSDANYSEAKPLMKQRNGVENNPYRLAERRKHLSDQILANRKVEIHQKFAESSGGASYAVDSPDPAKFAPPRRIPRSIIGEVVPDPARDALETRNHLPPIKRSPEIQPRQRGHSKNYPPEAAVDRENMQVSEIKGIFESHGIPYHDYFSKSQLLYLLDQKFPVLGAPGPPSRYDEVNENDKLSFGEHRGSVPPGWESRLPGAAEMYSHDKTVGFPTLDEPRRTESNVHITASSSPVPLRQKTSGPEITQSRPRFLEMGNLYAPILSEGWTADCASLNEGGRLKHINSLTGAEHYALPDGPAATANAGDLMQMLRPSSATQNSANFWMKALYDFDPQYEEDLRFSKGDMIRVMEGQIDKTTQSGWLVGEVNGRKGTFPANYCQLVIWMRALFDFDPQYEGDLRLSTGDLIQIKDVENSKMLPDGWLTGEVNGRSGMFPANYCEVIAAASGAKTDGQTTSAITNEHVPNFRLSFISPQDQVKFRELFKSAAREEPTLSGEKARDILMRSGLDVPTLSYIWMLADTMKSGSLYFPEFALAMYLCSLKLAGKSLPLILPENIRKEVSKMVDWIISHEPAPAHHRASGIGAPGFRK